MTTEKLFLGKRFRYDSHYRRPDQAAATIVSEREISEKVLSGKYRYEGCACYCGSDECVTLAERDLYGHYYPFVICKRCGIMRANPRLSEESLEDIYAKDYRNLYGNVERDKEELYLARLEQADKVHAFITRHVSLSRGAVVFDIGCHMGTMLIPFQAEGCDVMGVDFGIEGIEFGRSKSGLDLAIGGVETLKDSGRKADLVILNHTLEHFFDLDRDLSNISSIMAEVGHIFVAVPGTFWWIEHLCGGDIMNMLQSAHTWQFSLTTLKYVMECNGFELVYGSEKIFSLFRKSEKATRRRDDVPDGEYERVMVYLKRLEAKHRLKRFASKAVKAVGLYDAAKHLLTKARSRRPTLIDRYYENE